MCLLEGMNRRRHAWHALVLPAIHYILMHKSSLDARISNDADLDWSDILGGSAIGSVSTKESVNTQVLKNMVV